MTVTPDSPIAELKLSRNLTDLLSRYNYGTVGTLIARPRTAIAARLPMHKDIDAIDATQQMADDLPERYNLGRSCGVTATLLAATVALLTALVRKAGAR